MRGRRFAEITVTVAAAYLTFRIGEHYLHVAGVVAVVTTALVISYFGRTKVSAGTWSSLADVWQQVGYWAKFADLPARQSGLRRLGGTGAGPVRPFPHPYGDRLIPDLIDRNRSTRSGIRPVLTVPGEMIVRKGAIGDALYFIASGAVGVDLPSHPVRLGSGEFFGKMALITGAKRTADIRTPGFCSLLVLQAQDFQARVSGHDHRSTGISLPASSSTSLDCSRVSP